MGEDEAAGEADLAREERAGEEFQSTALLVKKQNSKPCTVNPLNPTPYSKTLNPTPYTPNLEQQT